MPSRLIDGRFACDFPFGMAAAYGFHLVANRPFLDGNERTAFATMVVFLRMNGWRLGLPDERTAELMLEMISLGQDEAWLTARVASVSRARPSWELRDFLRALTFEQIAESLGAGLTDADPHRAHQGRAASMIEAARAIPAINIANLGATAAEAAGDDRGASQLRAMSHLLRAMHANAEDMGYEW